MAPIAPMKPDYRIWIVWLAVAIALLLAKPWGTFSWDEWLAVSAPLLLLHPALRRLDVLVIGVAASGLAWFGLSHQSGGWPELASLLTVVVVGTLVGAASLKGAPAVALPAAHLGQVASEKLFFDALNREMCRMRRDKGSFAVLSVDLVGADSGTSLDSVASFLDGELRAYADIAQVGSRILVLVPDVDDGQAQPLLKRLTANWQAIDERELRIGLARFPQDAICAANLVEHADRKRLVRGISPIPVEHDPEIQGQVSM